jgi:AcrR family transcriptional regulator
MEIESINKKDKILEAARDIFFKKSFYEATMDDIALLSGVKKPTIYYYFPSKIDLASQLLEVKF